MESRYSIQQVEVLSDIKAHTLRIWEKRYGIIEPKRTDTNFRYFDDEDLKKILNISFLNKSGIKISNIAKLSNKNIEDKVIEIYNQSKGNPEIIQLLVAALMEFKVESFEKIFDEYLLENDFVSLVNNIIYPFFDRIGILWQTNKICPAQEHLFSQYAKQKLLSEIEKLPSRTSGKRVLIYLRENEYHELGMLVYQYILREKGYTVYNIGQSVPVQNLQQVTNNLKPHIVLSAFVSFLEEESFNEYIKSIKDIFKTQELYFSGNIDFLEKNNSNNHFSIIKNVDDVNSMF